MKPSQLYERQPERESLDLSYLRGKYANYDHLPELGDKYEVPLDLSANKYVVVRFYKEFHFDSRRFWALASVWYNGRPVMIVQNAGREGDDHRHRFITNEELFRKMLGYIWSISTMTKDVETTDIVDKDSDIPDLTDFYGNRLDGHFERSRW